MAEGTQKKKKLQMPDTYVIVVGLIVLMIILTWIIPAGQFDYSEDGKTVIAGTYHAVEANPQGLWDFLNSFFNGMKKGVNTMFVVLLIGGAFGVLSETGSISAALGVVVKKTKGDYKLVTVAVIVVMSILGALGTGNNVALAFAPIMILLYTKMGLDSIVVVATMYFASNSGFSASPMNPFTVLLGQSISGIPSMSGALPRVLMWFVFTGIAVWYTLRYCKKVKLNPAKSITGVYVAGEGGDADSELDKVEKLNIRHILCLIILAGVFIVYAIGGINWSWDMPQLGAMMMAMTFLVAIAGGVGPNRVAKAFLAGAKTQMYSVLLIGFASAINVIMTDGKIIHSVIYGLSLPLQYLPTFLSAVGMFIVNFLFNFFVSSGSGQCYIVMPLMAPLADLLGMTRQVAISAFQYGDGLCNVMIPTSGLLMGTLGIANVPYQKWIKFAAPVTGIMSAAAAIFLIIVTLVGWA